MKFMPQSENEITRSQLLEPGVYPFEVTAASDEISRTGNEMIKLKLIAYAPDGSQGHVYDYLLEKLAYKLRHFAVATGLLAEYERGELEAVACLGAKGLVKLGIEEANGQYKPKNTVLDYLPPDPAAAPAAPPAAPSPRPVAPKAAPAAAPVAEAAAAATFNDDIPF